MVIGLCLFVIPLSHYRWYTPRLQALGDMPLSFNYCLTSVCKPVTQWQTVQFFETPTEILKHLEFLPLNFSQWHSADKFLFGFFFSVVCVHPTDNECVLRLMEVTSHGPKCVLLSSYCHPTFTDGYTQSPISGHSSDNLWMHQILEDMRHTV